MCKDVHDYLAKLKKELGGNADPALVQDALSDAETHLRTALEEEISKNPGISETEIEQAHMDQKRVMVAIPTYNEADNLPTMIGELLALDVPGLEILIIDDNSPDGTGQLADDLAQRHPDQCSLT